MKTANKDLTLAYYPRLRTAKGVYSQIMIRYMTDRGRVYYESFKGYENESKESLFNIAPDSITICELCNQVTDSGDLSRVLITGRQARRGYICSDCKDDDNGAWKEDILEILGDALRPSNLN